MWMTRTIITWNRLTSVINFGMCTDLINGCIIKSGDGMFYFVAMVLSLSMRKLFTKIFVKRERWSPHNKFWCLVLLKNIDPTNFGGRDHLVSEVQRQGIRKKYWYTLTKTVWERKEKENKHKYMDMKLDMEQSIATIK